MPKSSYFSRRGRKEGGGEYGHPQEAITSMQQDREATSEAEAL